MTPEERKAINAITTEMETDVAAWRFQASHGTQHHPADIWHWVEEYAARLRAVLAGKASL